MTGAFAKVFFITFALGMAAVFLMNKYVLPEERSNSTRAINGVANGPGKDTGSGNAYELLVPLKLPISVVSSQEGVKGGWEFSGFLNANFVSARAQLDSWMQNQGWIPENKISLDESIEPRVILTFSRGSQEMTMFLWKISTDSTGFAYKREYINKEADSDELK